jgi:membrane protein YqaA with SNARE-associated domain
MLDYYSYGLIGLFLICFLAATILPFSSELVVITFLLSNQYSNISIIAVATIGNSLGSALNYFLGYIGNHFWLKKFGAGLEKYKINQFIMKKGSFAAIFAWLPIVGDPLMFALGFYKTNVFITFTLMSLGKFIRYISLLLFL